MNLTSRTTFRSIFTSARLGLIAAGLLLGSAAQAAPLNLTQVFPDFTVNELSFSYDGVDTLTISGTPASFTQVAGGDQHPVTDTPTTALFSLAAVLDASGNVTSGSFDLTGTVRDVNNLGTILFDGVTDPGGLLGGDLVAFGFSSTSASTGILEFTFNNADGLIADLGPYSGGGMILNLTSSDMSNFDTDLLTSAWTGIGTGDVFVPVPAAMWLFGSGLLGLAGIARKKPSSQG